MAAQSLFIVLHQQVPPWLQLQELHLKCTPASIEDLMVLLQRCRHSLQVLKIDIMRMYANVGDVKQMLRTLSDSFPAFVSDSFDSFTLGVIRRDYFINSPVVAENPFVDELQGTNLSSQPIIHGVKGFSCGLLRSKDGRGFGYPREDSGWRSC